MSVGTRLAAVDTTTVCDGPGQHDVRIITDGQVTYAYGLGTAATDCGPASRVHLDHVWINVTCRQPLPHGQTCDGVVSAAITAPGSWSSDTEALALLEQYGEQVDR